jgi:polysaccharide pyruvyl transferase WcaK-like protein/uncharacterized coiled-coil protein SlyX
VIRLVVMGDLGDPAGYHAGDEAMAEAAVLELAARTELAVTAVSGDPADTRERYGWEAVARFGFSDVEPSVDGARDARLRAVLDGARGEPAALGWDDPAWDVIHAVAAADAVLVAGGGNLNSWWPVHVYERAALAGVAAAFGRPVVVSGQTLGPALTGRHGELVSGTLTSARLVGVREAASFDVARSLGVLEARLALTVDDATFVPGEAVVDLPARAVAVTFASHTGMLDPTSFVASVARLLEHTVDVTGLDVVMVPHQGRSDEASSSGDVALHEQIRDSMSRHADRIRLLPVLTARQIAAVTRSAELVLSSRYHPVVFGLGAGVPTLGLVVDEYTSTKIHGALANFGAGAHAFSVAALLDGSLEEAVTDVWARRADISATLTATAAVRATESRAWWDAVVVALDDGAPAPTGLDDVDAVTPGPWAERVGAQRAWLDELSRRTGSAELSIAELTATIEGLEATVAELRLAVASLQATCDEAAEEADDLRRSAQASQLLAAEVLAPLLEWVDEQPRAGELEAELQALRDTRTFRYLRVPRELYRRTRER